MINYIGLDFEASGTNPWGEHVPIQIGVATSLKGYTNNLIGGWNWKEFEWDEVAAKVHNIPQADIDSADPVWKVDIRVAADLLDVGLGSRMWNVIVGWNVAGYDRQFITRWMPNLNRLLSYRTVDLNAVVFSKAESEQQYENIKRASKEYAQAKIGESNWHNAGYDALAALHSLEYLRTMTVL